MENNNTIKSIFNLTCPHCEKTFFVESRFAPPAISSVFTTEEAKQAKVDCLERLDSITIEDEQRELVIKWITDPNTIFGPDEVEPIIMSLLKPQDEEVGKKDGE